MNILSRSEEIVLLAVWKLKDSAFGVTIGGQVSKDAGADWAFGAVSKPLKQLARKGFVEKSSSELVAERGGRARSPCTLTVGYLALRSARENPVRSLRYE
jgi:hypothetical protein